MDNKKSRALNNAGIFNGGRGGIRTLGTENRTPPFQGGTFNHSATLPWCCVVGSKLYW